MKEYSEFVPLAICHITVIGNIIDINSAFKKLTGYEELEIIGQSVEFLFPSKNDASRIKNTLMSKDELRGKEVLLITKDKETIPVSIYTSIRKDLDGEIIGFFLAFTDIREFKALQDSLEVKVKERTEELEKMQRVLLDTLDEVKLAKKKVEKENNKTAAIISNFADPVFVVDKSWRIILYNPAAEKIFAIRENVLGLKLNVKNNNFSFECFRDISNVGFDCKAVEKNSGEKFIEEVTVSAVKTDEGVKNVFSYSLPEISGQVFKVVTLPIWGAGKTFYGYMKIFNDLTREKIIDRMKSEFISIAAHQLRTPLSSIKWAIQMVIDGDTGPISAEQKDMLQKGAKSNEAVIQLVNDMLNVSRIEEGKFGFNFEKLSLNKILDEVLKEAGTLSEEMRQNFKSDIQADMPPIKIDQERIKLALSNLMENAIKYTPEFGKITVSAKKEGDNIIIIIEDSGVGIPREEMGRLFMKFFRASNVVKLRTEGNGLGLFIVKNIIENHGGNIKIESEEGKGTKATINLPI
jgi:two-component system phosphate regulon sensor histidine kinase PhoR